jgi:nucleoside-diphosphate-sugar epimerase
MARAYCCLVEADKKLVAGEIFNVGFENQTVQELALLVKKVISNDVKIKKIISNDNRSYHISSKKIERVLGFKSVKKIEDAIVDLKEAFISKRLVNTLNNEFYFNIKRMNSINLE